MTIPASTVTATATTAWRDHRQQLRRVPNNPPPRDDDPWDKPSPQRAGSPFRRGTVYTRSQLADLPRIESMVDDLMSSPATVVVVGAYGLGKSVLTLGIAASVATGRPWLGRRVVRRRVLVVVGEGANGLDNRMAAWEAAWFDGEPISDADLEFLVKPASLTEATTWLEIENYAVAGGFGLVIFDTFSSLAPDADETKSAAGIMRSLSDLSALINGTAVLVHHPGWSDATRTRGGYQFEANADEVLVLSGVATGSDLVSLTRKKVKDGPDGQVIWLRREPSKNSVVMGQVMPGDIGAPLRERIIAVLAGCGETGATGPQLMKEIGAAETARSGFYKALNGLVNEDVAASVGSRRAMRYYLAEHAPEAQP